MSNIQEKVVIRKIKLTYCPNCEWHRNYKGNYSCGCECHVGGFSGAEETVISEEEPKE